MKLIISQDNQQVFTCGDCQIYSLSTVEIPSDAKAKKSAALFYSVGVAGISFGVFKEKDKAAAILMDITRFLAGKDVTYTVPQDDPSEEMTDE